MNLKYVFLFFTHYVNTGCFKTTAGIECINKKDSIQKFPQLCDENSYFFLFYLKLLILCKFVEIKESI